MRSVFFLLLTLSASFSYGDIAKHLKKPLDKDEGHSIRNIDFIYVINLDQRPEKFESCVKQLAPYGIRPYRFSAVNGWELPFETINDVGVKFQPGMQGAFWGTSYFSEMQGAPKHELIQNYGQTYFCHCMSRGAIAIVLSHLSVLQDAYDSGYETIWVMEDDIEILKNPHVLSELIDKLDQLMSKNGWDVLFTDRDTKNQKGDYVPCLGYALRPNFTPPDPLKFQSRKNVSKDFSMIGARYGAYSMIVRRSGMKKILDFIKTHYIFLPYDMDNYLPPSIRMFAVQNDVVSTQPKALSDNGAPNYLKKAGE